MRRVLPSLQRRPPTDWPAVLKEITDSGLSLADVAHVLDMPKQTIHTYVKARPGCRHPAIPNHPDGCAVLDLLALVRGRAGASPVDAKTHSRTGAAKRMASKAARSDEPIPKHST